MQMSILSFSRLGHFSNGSASFYPGKYLHFNKAGNRYDLKTEGRIIYFGFFTIRLKICFILFTLRLKNYFIFITFVPMT